MASAYGNQVTNELNQMFSPENVMANQQRKRQMMEQNTLASIMNKHKGNVDSALPEIAMVSPEYAFKVDEMKKSQAAAQAQANKPVSMAAGGVLFDPVTRQPILTAPTKPEKIPDWKDPAYLAYQRELEKFKAGLKPSATGTPGGVKLSPTAQKELFESDDTVQASKNVQGLLTQALSLNKKAYSGIGAKTGAVIASNIPFIDAPEGADATINLDNLMTGQALESLKSVFGGMPTEGERKILLELQASADKTPKQREDIITRAIAAAKRREQFNADRAKSLRAGTYFSENPTTETNDQWSDL